MLLSLLGPVLTFIQSKIFPYVLVAILVVILTIVYQGNVNQKRKAKLAEQNRIAASDSIRIEKGTNGELRNSISGFIASEKELKRINAELFKEVKEEKGKVLTLNRVVLRLKQTNADLEKYLVQLESQMDSVIAVNDSIFQIPWKLTFKYDENNYDIFEGKSQILIGVGSREKLRVQQQWTRMTSRESSINLTFGQKIEDGQLRVYVNSNYPGLTTSSLKGVLIDPNKNPYIKSLIKKRHWFTGFGVGPNLTMGYDFMNGNPAFIVGVGLQYNIYQW